MILRLLKLLPRISEAVASLQVKGWYLSKTIWANLLVLAGSIAYAVTGNDVLTITSDEAAALSVGFVAVGNIVLRILTSKPVGMRSVPGSVERGSEGPDEDSGSIGV